LRARLWLKKKVTRLANNPKGFSSIIGSVFMVLVVLLLSTGVFMWTLSQNTMYNEAVRARNQEEADRQNENVVAVSGNYSVSGDQVTVKVVLKNAGSIAVQIINLWVLDTDPSNRRYANKSLSLNLNPGNVTNLVESSPLTVTIPGASSSHIFASWFATTRGNTIPLEKEQSIIVAQLAQGIGSLALDFQTFRYFTYETSTKLANYSQGIKSFNVPGSGTPIAFGANLTNLDPSKQTLTFNVYSNMWLVFPGAPGQTPQWYIVNVATDGTIAPSYSPISLAYGETKLVVFASSRPVKEVGSFSTNSISPAITPNPCAVNLLLLGILGTRDYGQNIPFVSLYVYKP